MKKTILGALLALSSLLLAGQSLAASGFATRAVNVRSGPALTYEVVDQLVAGEPVDIGNCNADRSWCYVRHEGTNGWVAAVFLTAANPSQPKPTPTPPTPPVDTNAYYAKNNLNVRSGPGAQYAIVDRLDANEQVTRGQCSSDGIWCYVTHDGSDGWVSAAFIAPVQNEDDGTSPPPPPSGASSAYYVNRAVNVRTGPGTQFAIVDRLETNEQVTRKQCTTNGEWCYVDHDGPDGWVASSFLTSAADQGPVDDGTSPPPSGGSTAYYANRAVNVRSGPGFNFNVVDRLDVNERVTRTRCTTNGTWCYVDHNGPDGWVASGFLTAVADQGPVDDGTSPPPPTSTYRLAVSTTGMAVRSAPTLFTGVTGRLERGQQVRIDRCTEDGSWCHVAGPEVTGWAFAAFLHFTTQPPAPEPEPEPEPEPASYEVLTTTRIFIRSGPGQNYSVVGQLPPQTSVTIERCNFGGDWCQITRNSTTGWVAAAFLEVAEDSPPPSSQPQTSNAVCFTGFGGVRICLSE